MKTNLCIYSNFALKYLPQNVIARVSLRLSTFQEYTSHSFSILLESTIVFCYDSCLLLKSVVSLLGPSEEMIMCVHLITLSH